MVQNLTNKIHDPTVRTNSEEKHRVITTHFLKKWIQTQKRNPEVPIGFYDPNAPENFPSDLKRTPEGFLVSENEGDIKTATKPLASRTPT